MTKFIAVLWAIGFAFGISIFAGPDYDVYGLVSLERPPPLYEALYEQTERCLDEQGDFDRVVWFLADSIKNRQTDATYAGLRYNDAVILLKNLALQPHLIRHESIHHIMDGASEHEAEFWKRCQYGPLPDGVDIPEDLG